MILGRLFSLILVSWTLVWAEIPAGSRQLLVVTTPNWSASGGRLQRYERISGVWKKVGKDIAVKVGRKGLAWGKGLHTTPKGAKRIKKEGDGKAPAGIFMLPYVFSEYTLKIRYTYRKMTKYHHCVDDSRSKYYNKVINSKKVKKDYKSFEHMKFHSGLYSYGIFVGHNPESIAGAGSCIFLHIKRSNGKPTVGCTAMSREQIVDIIKWLDPEKKPLLVQAPKSYIRILFK